MGSAFTPVQPRGATPTGGLPGRRPSKRSRQVSSMQKMVLQEVDEVDEDRTVETIPDTCSEASSKASNNSQPPLLDFIGQTCMASAWFTSCFPCAVVDINDSDDYVVDKLSRESAMNVMYGSHVAPVSPEVSPVTGRPIQSKGSDQEKNMLYVQLPESNSLEEVARGNSIPSVIEEESDDEDEPMDEISLIDDEDGSGMPLPERVDSGIVDTRSDVPIYKPPKKKFSVKKMFGKKKKAASQ